MPHLHLSLQHGDDLILKRMKRRHSRADAIALAARARRLRPDMVFGADLIAGFPTETDSEFEETLEVIERVRFDSAFIFKYSERKNTIAERKYPDDVPEAVKSERVVRLNEIQKAISIGRNRAWIGRTVQVLLEGPSRKSVEDLLGRDDGNHGVVLPRARLQPGDLVAAEVVGASAHTLLARPCGPDRAPRYEPAPWGPGHDRITAGVDGRLEGSKIRMPPS